MFVTSPPKADGPKLQFSRFDGPCPTWLGELALRQMAKPAIGSLFVVVLPPVLDDLLSVIDPHQVMNLQALVPQPSVERQPQAIIRGLSPLGKVGGEAVLRGPLVRGARGELRAVIGGN